MIINGVEIQIDGMEIEPTYRGLIIGIPSPEINGVIMQEKIESLQKKCDKVFLINPSNLERLGQYCFQLELSSDWVNGDYDYSCLGVIFFTDETPWNQPLGTLIEKIIKDINWQENAVSYRF